MNNFAQLVRTTLPTSVRAEADPGHLPRLLVRTATAEADVYFQGAHVTGWRPASSPDPVLWLSAQSRFEPGQAIRGGVPVCFPWFSKHRTDRSAPPHGFARTRDWTLEMARHGADGSVVLEMELAGEALAPLWPHRFRARHRITIGAALRLDLEVLNTGPDAFTFEEALHAYFDVGDIREVTVSGLERAAYQDKAAGDADGLAGPDLEPIRFTGPINRIYPGTREACVIHDPVRRRDIVISKSGSASTVVWNPWADRAREMSDMGDEEWIGMVCVEPSNVGADARTLAPGESHTMTVVIETHGW
jgi:glucose-6-phosphate 1-epimerase